MVTEEHESGMVAMKVSKELVSGGCEYEPLGGVGEQVECRIVVEEKVLWVAVLRLDNIGTLNRIAAEKDGLETWRSD